MPRLERCRANVNWLTGVGADSPHPDRWPDCGSSHTAAIHAETTYSEASSSCHARSRLLANPPKGGDAKPPVYGTHVPMTAGLPVGFQTVFASHLAVHPKARLQNAWVRHSHLILLLRGLLLRTGALCVPVSQGSSARGGGAQREPPTEQSPGSVSPLTFYLTLR